MDEDMVPIIPLQHDPGSASYDPDTGLHVNQTLSKYLALEPLVGHHIIVRVGACDYLAFKDSYELPVEVELPDCHPLEALSIRRAAAAATTKTSNSSTDYVSAGAEEEVVVPVSGVLSASEREGRFLRFQPKNSSTAPAANRNNTSELHQDHHSKDLPVSTNCTLPTKQFVPFAGIDYSFQQALSVPEREMFQQPVGFFTAQGFRITTTEEWEAYFSENNEVFLIEGGQWIWPPVRIGFVNRVKNMKKLVSGDGGVTQAKHGDTLEIETLSVRPAVFRIRFLISEDEAAELIDWSQPRLSNSTVVSMTGEEAENTVDSLVRISEDYR